MVPVAWQMLQQSRPAPVSRHSSVHTGSPGTLEKTGVQVISKELLGTLKAGGRSWRRRGALLLRFREEIISVAASVFDDMDVALQTL